MATDSEVCGTLQGHSIFRVKGIEILPLKDYRYKDPVEEEYIHLLKGNLNTAPLYFSRTWDLSNAYQRQSGPTEYVWKKADERFFWNSHVSQELIDAATIQPLVGDYIMPVIYGYVNLAQTTINGHIVTFGLITRRSRWRAGTRYFRRGIDDEGSVANYNETEQILCVPTTSQPGQPSAATELDVSVFSYVQTRGSVPVYWAEINNLRYRPKLKIGGNPVHSAKLHFGQQEKIYGKNFLVNLVNQKGYELPVKDAYEKVVEELDNPNLQYVYFDFHQECSKMRWHRVQNLIDTLLGLGMDQQGWYEAKIGREKSIIEQIQQSVVRTNCMDCLDRTNVVQSQLARRVLQKQLEASGVLISLTPQDFAAVDPKFEVVFRNMWADNADAVSKSYSGTGALKTDFTRLGKRTNLGALADLKNSISRYAKNNLFDGPRQDGFDLFLGNHLPFKTLESPFRDMRPISYQAMPYLVFGSLILTISALLFPKEDSSWVMNKLFLVIWIALLGFSIKFLLDHGLQYVNWPKLMGLDYVRKVPAVASNNKARSKLSAGLIMSEVSTPESKLRGLEEGKRE